jgi:hypothetical protein
MDAEEIERCWSRTIEHAKESGRVEIPDGVCRPVRILSDKQPDSPITLLTVEFENTADLRSALRYGEPIYGGSLLTFGPLVDLEFSVAWQQCSATVRLLRREVKQVRETPGTYYYRDAHSDMMTTEAARDEPFCCLRGQHEQHAALLAEVDADREKDCWITWRAGVIDSRKLIQPGTCLLLNDLWPGSVCLAGAGHEGGCLPNGAARLLVPEQHREAVARVRRDTRARLGAA